MAEFQLEKYRADDLLFNGVLEIHSQNVVIIKLLAELLSLQTGSDMQEMYHSINNDIIKESQDLRDRIFADDGVIDFKTFFNNPDKDNRGK